MDGMPLETSDVSVVSLESPQDPAEHAHIEDLEGIVLGAGGQVLARRAPVQRQNVLLVFPNGSNGRRGLRVPQADSGVLGGRCD